MIGHKKTMQLLENFEMLVISVPLSLIVGFCAVMDFRFQKIPNLITLPAAILALGLHFYQDGLSGVYFGLAGWGLGFILLIIPYTMRFIGAGDVKLLAAIGAIVGPWAVFVIFLYTSVIGGIYALYHLILSEKLQHGFNGFYQSIKHMVFFRKNIFAKPFTVNKQSHLRYGIAIAAGTFVYLGETIGIYDIIA